MIARNIGIFIKDRGYNLAEIARKTDLDYLSLYTSLYNERRNRDLRAEELVPLCTFLGVDPREFSDDRMKLREEMRRHERINL